MWVHTALIILSKTTNKQFDQFYNAWNLDLKWGFHIYTTYLIKDPLLFFMMSRTVDVSFPCSHLLPSITFLFQIDASVQTDVVKLKHKQPEVVIVYVGGSIQCCSIWFVFTSISFQYLIKGPNWWMGK